MTEKTQFGRMHIDDEKAANPAPGVWMIPGFGNTGVVETDEGLVLVDMPVQSYVKRTMGMLREISDAPVDTVFLTHGHLDHAVNTGPLFDEAVAKGWGRPRVVAQRNLVRRLNKYRMLDGYHEHINRIQFNVPEGRRAFPVPECNPDVMFDQSISIRVGGVDVHAFHGLGETDDHLWVWVPEKKTIFAGDFVIWSFPNVGNPFKVQRYTLEWAESLEAMTAKGPEILVPGHGPVIEGYENIRRILMKFSAALRYLHKEVVDRLNRGMWYEDILHEVTLPDHMLDDEFLAPRYGCPEFVVHGILRQYTGWYDGNPSNLFPPKKSDIASEVAGLVGGDRLLAHAMKLKSEGNEAMALQFVDMALAGEAGGDDRQEAHRMKSELLDAAGHKAESFIAKSIYFIGRDKELAIAEGKG
ncbi:MAG: MBL fold metallo-hydrolase [Deltaproteobacteria bacterium]|nr:MBL fold metallo-hydrolase [Deltaproteobacteria bacterium]